MARVTPLDQPGTHAYQFSPCGQWALHTFSSFGRPPATELVRLPDHRVVRTLVGNARLRAKLDALEGDRGEFFRVEIGGGLYIDSGTVTLNGKTKVVGNSASTSNNDIYGTYET
jgi:dipeptidyl-peptidase 4